MYKYRIPRSVELTMEQLREIPSVLENADFENDDDGRERPPIFELKQVGSYGKYVFRVNRSRKVVTLLEIIRNA